MLEQEKIIEHLDAVFRDMESRLNGRAGSHLHTLHKASFEALRSTHFPDWRRRNNNTILLKSRNLMHSRSL